MSDTMVFLDGEVWFPPSGEGGEGNPEGLQAALLRMTRAVHSVGDQASAPQIAIAALAVAHSMLSRFDPEDQPAIRTAAGDLLVAIGGEHPWAAEADAVRERLEKKGWRRVKVGQA